MMSLQNQLRQDLIQAQSELSAVRVDIGNLMAKEEMLEWQIKYLSKLLGIDEQATPQPHKESRPAVSAMTAPQMVETVLRESGGKPMRVMDIVKRMMAKGYGGPNADFRKTFANVSSLLSRGVKNDNSVFRKEGRGLFGLKQSSSTLG